jgi:hypothetical protein
MSPCSCDRLDANAFVRQDFHVAPHASISASRLAQVIGSEEAYLSFSVSQWFVLLGFLGGARNPDETGTDRRWSPENGPPSGLLAARRGHSSQAQHFCLKMASAVSLEVYS